jgi:hypothetical protein
MDAAARHRATVASIAIAVPLVVLNGAFYLLASRYFADLPATVSSPVLLTWIAFAVSTAILGSTVFCSVMWPRGTGHVLAFLLGLGALANSIGAFSRGMPGVLSWTLVVIGLVLPTLTVLSWRRVRAAWAFVISICGVLAVVTLFGAPKVRAVVGGSLWSVIAAPGLYIIAVVSLARVHADYRDQGAGVSST